MSKPPKAFNKNGDANLGDVVSKYLEWSDGVDNAHPLWVASILHAAGESGLAGRVAGTVDEIVASAASASPNHMTSHALRALALLGRAEEASTLLATLSETTGRAETGIVLGALAAAGRIEDVRALAATVSEADLSLVLTFGVEGVATLPPAEIAALVALVEPDSRTSVLTQVLPATVAATVLDAVALDPESRASILLDAGKRDEAAAALGAAPTEDQELLWNQLRFALGVIDVEAAAAYAASHAAPGHKTTLAGPLLDLASALVDRGDLDAATTLLGRVSEHLSGDLSKYDLGRVPELSAHTLALEARVAHLKGDPKSAAALLKAARVKAGKSGAGFDRILAEELAMKAPFEAYQTVKKMPRQSKGGAHVSRVAVSYLPDLAGALLAIEALAERGQLLDATRELMQAALRTSSPA